MTAGLSAAWLTNRHNLALLFRPFALLIFPVLFFSLGSSSLGQTPQQIEQALQNGELIAALEACQSLLSTNETVFASLSPESFALGKLQKMDDSLNAVHMRTILNIYRFYQQNYPEQNDYWLKMQGLSVILYQDSLSNAFFPTLRRTLSVRPQDMPSLFIEHFSERLLRTIESGQGRQEEWIANFCFLENIWLNLDTWSPEQVKQAGVYRLRLAELLQTMIPSCAELQTQFEAPLRREIMRPTDYRFLYTCMRLNGCQRSNFRDSVLYLYPRIADEPYAQRIAAIEAMDQGEHLQALPWLERAIELEQNPYFKAQDFLRLAELYRQISNFRTARLYVEYADETLPDWGRPHLFLAEMVAQSGPFCNFTQLEQKATKWLAIDYCEEAMNSNPQLESEAIKLIQQYRRAMPSQEEVIFYNFQIGDSFPLRCWLETATRVRY